MNARVSMNHCLQNDYVDQSSAETVLPLSCTVSSFSTNAISSYSNSLPVSADSTVQMFFPSVLEQRSHTSRTSTIEELSIDEADSSMLSTCRICQLSSDEADIGSLISPCRCTGTLKFVHRKCLAKWLEVRSWQSRKPPACELCHYQFRRHKTLKLRCWRCPSISTYDKLLHLLFVVCVFIMSGCITAMVLCFAMDRGNAGKLSGLLSSEEGVTLICGIIFFVAFFVAAFVEIRVERSIYRLICDLLTHNVDWHIDDYDRAADVRRPVTSASISMRECQTAV